MSSDGICIAITHTGARCTSVATDAAGHCAHHARIARVMALAPKPTSTLSTPPPPSRPKFPPNIPQLSAPTNAFDLSSLKSAGPIKMTFTSPTTTPTPSSSSILQSPLIAASLAASAPTPTSSSSSPHSAWMLPCESVLSAVNASFISPSTLGLPALPGSLFITTFRLRFEPLNASLRSPGHFHRLLDDAIVGIPRGCVAKLTYPQSASASRSKYDAPTQLVIKFKDLRSWTLGGELNTLMTMLNRHVFVDSPLSLFAFIANGMASKHDEDLEREGHRIYDLHHDFQRMGVDVCNSAFRVTEVNRNYAICATYPQLLVVPSSMSDTEIANVAEFRSKGRLPICCFVHPRNQASLWRCAQPKRGIFNAQNVADERYLARIAASNRNQPKIWIADCRPELNARVNNLTGGGTESSGLQHARLSFLNIANIHSMRESIDNVRSLAMTSNPDVDFTWLGRVEETKWLGHIRLVLSAAVRVADAVENQQTSVLVHCSDGWDRTGQLCALSQLMLDAHYRTMVGFIQIVEKEWILTGHKFQDRVGPGKCENEEQSPIFLQFLDCVWQLWRQHPTYFEFNTKFLEEIADATYSGRYGTFLGNCDRERTTWGSHSRTPSLWTHLLLHKEQYTNPFYREQSERTLIPPASTLLRNVTLWTEYYFRGSTFDTVPTGNSCPPAWGAVRSTAKNPHEDLSDAMAAAVLKIRVMEQELQALRGEVPVPTPAVQVVSLHPSVAAPPLATLHEVNPLFPHATLQQVTTQAPPPAHTSSSPPPPPGPASTIVLPPGSWTCAICSKANPSEFTKCVVCGRPPPAAAMVTQL